MFTHSIIIFTKAPIIGKVKTRFQPAITKEVSFKIHTAFVKDMIAKIGAIQGVRKYLFYDFKEGNRVINNLIKGIGFKVFLQKGKDLGEKMQNALYRIMKSDMDKVVIIGTDSPTLPSEYISQAFVVLDKKDTVIGPATDGGYYLIGMKGHICGLFDNIEWGTNKVIRQTLDNVRHKNLSIGVLPPWYDIDTIDDIVYLKDHIELLLLSEEPVPENTYRYLLDVQLEKCS